MNLSLDIHYNLMDSDIASISVSDGNTKIEEVETFYHFYSEKEWKKLASFAISILNDLYQFGIKEEWEDYIVDNLSLEYYEKTQ